ncbi:tyrosine-type recombinase/integrase [Stackebrandtia nassauensis]|uniref:Regulatory protein GntR HTH n=1 Tax=Stackebrandtia nassauensis (strain DSM 44728 / CIP 108903 / NRRL B-16338 / NBRC 102104 / LLR-40K-21) TaxID=446470 RepID=D3Q2V4_STANL|nr:tyrosine-type recombinase/integrase [Stackebrandtia nassauensis]ADD45855.1 regulatory protein GntR HTH [Stackebrandtia nassauensis DSM 44728]
MSSRRTPEKRQRGRIEVLKSGSLRVSVYAGQDALTKKRNYLTETITLSPNASAKQQREAWDLAERTRRRFITEVDERRHPRTNATVAQALDRYFDPKQTSLKISENTRSAYESEVANHIRPLLGHLRIADIDAEVLDSFDAKLRTCRAHCEGRRFTEHRTKRPHDCDDRCGPHLCKPLAEYSIAHIRAVLSGVFKRAIRWKWITVNPMAQAEELELPPPDPQPVSAVEAARIANEAWKDPDWGMLVWLKMRTGLRRGEVCALKLGLLDLDAAVLRTETAIAQKGKRTWEKPTKTHRKRRIALTVEDVELLRAYLEHRGARANELGLSIEPTGRLFSLSPDHSAWLKPDSVSQRFDRMVTRLGIDTTIKNLRHYSATELIAAGVDVRTVAGRLGHGGGGTTTLRVYSAFLAEADQKAAELTSARMPQLPSGVDHLFSSKPEKAVPEEPSMPYERIAADLAGAIRSGILSSGDRIPAQHALATRYGVAPSTAHRALELLKKDGLIQAARGVPATVI